MRKSNHSWITARMKAHLFIHAAFLFLIAGMIFAHKAHSQSEDLLPVKRDDCRSMYAIVSNLWEERNHRALLKDDDIESAIQALDQEGYFKSDAERAHFRAALQLKPLMGTDLTYRALSDELAHRGLTSKKGAVAAMKVFSSFPLEEQMSIVSGVVRRLALAIDDSVSINNVEKLQKDAEYVRMDLTEYAEFLKRWRAARNDGFGEVRLAILLNLLMRQKSATDRVAYFRSWRGKFHDWLSGRKKNPSPDSNFASVKNLVSTESLKRLSFAEIPRHPWHPLCTTGNRGVELHETFKRDVRYLFGRDSYPLLDPRRSQRTSGH